MGTVLVADADTQMQQALAACLRAEGLNAAGIGEGLAAPEMARSQTFDLIVVDLQLPD